MEADIPSANIANGCVEASAIDELRSQLFSPVVMEPKPVELRPVTGLDPPSPIMPLPSPLQSYHRF